MALCIFLQVLCADPIGRSFVFMVHSAVIMVKADSDIGNRHVAVPFAFLTTG
jgi:hypothetical protein